MNLSIKNLTVHYDKAIAVNDVSFDVPDGGIVSIIGANGAGKSTILKAISGLIPITSGEILFGPHKLHQLKPHEIVKMGIVQIPEGRHLFPYLSVYNNLRLGASLRKDHKAIEKDMKEIFEYYPILAERRNQNAGTLSGGEQQMLAIARALMADPKLLAMDEPSLALSPKMVKGLVPIIEHINSRGISILLAEQNVPLALQVSKNTCALQVGKILLSGEVDLFKDNEIIKQCYLGG